MLDKRYLYHGTGANYLRNMVEKFGVYRHENSRDIFLSDVDFYAIEKGKERAEKFGDQPVLLVIDPNMVENLSMKLGDIWPSCPELRIDSFEVYEMKYKPIESGDSESKA